MSVLEELHSYLATCTYFPQSVFISNTTRLLCSSLKIKGFGGVCFEVGGIFFFFFPPKFLSILSFLGKYLVNSPQSDLVLGRIAVLREAQKFGLSVEPSLTKTWYSTPCHAFTDPISL